MTYQVKVSPKARLLLAEANEWWIENRPKAPSLVTEEASRILSFLTDSPNIGGLYRKLEGVEVRRMRLSVANY